ncbi:M81 family metallopeptidase [Roseinatronobacter sp. S2]|uniref:M81 family metallopeptidase n=1 Tax=Roseinatronobacter sp. S2 TaxID=3035471 RepID=UPI00240F32DD|nr:M81 family metallopeptidase [Roseinatronobacter sp. S2]WFE75817.1 M81 family metallopeptidase [Roseinatronobacter sp. S2]
MRVAIGGLHTECSSYNPVKMTDHDFTIWVGDEMLRQGYFDVLKRHDATYLPTFYARNIAGGPVASATYDRFKADFVQRLRDAMPLDGVYLAMHGAVFVEGMHDAEGDWISAARDVVGPSCVIAVSYDLHGNLSQRIIDAIDVFSTYRTAPHIDIPQTQQRTLDMLFRCLKTGQKPCLAWAPVPVLLPGERTSTEDEPAKSLYASLPDRESTPEIWDASLMVGYVWADEPRATAAAVITGTDPAKTQAAAEDLAQAYWDARDAFAFGMDTGSVQDCVTRAVASTSRPVILAESGDNPTGGGVGDRTELLCELLDQQAQDVIFAGICDLPAVDACFAAGENADVTLNIGGTLDPGSKPVTASGTVLRLHPGDRDDQRQAVVQISGVRLVLSARRRPYHKIADFAALGLDPRSVRILAVKSGYLSPELAPLANPAMMLLSPGVVDQYIERLPRNHKPAPTYPFDKGFDWSPQVYFKSAQS